MVRKKLKGFIKTRHFKERQDQREVSDRDVIKAIIKGKLTDNEDGQNFHLGSLKVTVNLTDNILITVHPGDPIPRSQRLLSKEEAKSIKEAILARAQQGPDEPDQDEFGKYVRDNKVRKLD